MSFLGGGTFGGGFGTTGIGPGLGGSVGGGSSSSTPWWQSPIFASLLGIGGNVLGSVLQGNAVGNASQQQAAAAQQAAQLQYQLGQQALGLQATGMQQQQQNIQPWLNAGGNALNQLQYLMGVGPNPSQHGQPPGPINPTNPTNPRLPFDDQGDPTNPNNFGPSGYTNFDATGTAGNINDGQTQTGGTTGATPPPPWQPNTSLGAYGSLNQPYGQTFNAPTWNQTFQAPTWDTKFDAPTWDQQFQAPTDVTEQNDPGYQFRLQQGQQALEHSAAAKGNIYNGGTAKALTRYGQDYASNEYGKVYDRAQQEYQQKYGEFLNKYSQKAGEYGQNYNQFLNNYQQQAGQYGQNYQQFQNNYNQQLGQYEMGYNQHQQQQAALYNSLASLAGVGQQSAGQLNSAIGNNATNQGNLLTQIGQTQANGLNGSAYYNAAGGVGQANIYGNLLNSLGSQLGQIGQRPVCWIAEELWGVDDQRTHLVRAWLNNEVRKQRADVVSVYERHGELVADSLERDSRARRAFADLFDVLLGKATEWQMGVA